MCNQFYVYLLIFKLQEVEMFWSSVLTADAENVLMFWSDCIHWLTYEN